MPQFERELQAISDHGTSKDLITLVAHHDLCFERAISSYILVRSKVMGHKIVVEQFILKVFQSQMEGSVA